MQLLIGADPELFVTKIVEKQEIKRGFRKTGEPFEEYKQVKSEEPVSAHGMVPGTKKKPHPVENGAVQVDGTALEFNIDPADNAETFKHNIHTVLSQLRSMIPEGLNISKNITSTFSDFMSLPKEAREIGCDPDYNAYTKKKNTNVSERNLGSMRMVGGHVHIGWTKDVDPMETSHFLSCCDIAKQLDWYLYIPSLILDGDKTRKKFYGLPGNFRPKPYGIEYRSLSSFWLHDDRYIDMVFNQSIKAVNDYVEKDFEAFKSFGDIPRNFSNMWFDNYYSNPRFEAKRHITNTNKFDMVIGEIKELLVNAK